MLNQLARLKATPESIAFEFDSSFDSIFFPSKYTGQSVFKARGINPNTGTRYGYSAETRKHTRTTTRGIVPVRAHTKYYSLGYKPVEGKDGKWYTASPENNFGLRMAQQKIQRNFLQNAWNKVYRKLPKEIRNDLPKAIQIQEQEKTMDISKVTQTQEYIIARHSKMVGKVLDLVEASLPEGNQCDKLKKLVQVPLYDFRNEMIQLDTKGLPDSEQLL